jgi:Protein of unknown function (DUF3078)
MKIKSYSIVFLSIMCCFTAYGQITDVEKKVRAVNTDTVMGWKKGGVFAVNLAQTSLTNWVAGGQNSLAVNGIFSLFANYKQGKSSWDNSLDLGYGLLKQGKNTDFMKTDDKIDFSSKYGRVAFGNFNYAAFLNFKTQMSPGYRYPDTENKISDFLAPGYILLALGLDYKPGKYFSTFIAPLTGKFTFVRDRALSNAGAFGVTPGETSRGEIGGYIRAIYTREDFKDEFLKNVAFTTKLDLFSNYRDNPQNIDVSWETLIVLKVNKFISVNFNTVLLYDDNIKVPVDRNGNGIFESTEAPGPRTQFKEILGVGFSYKF